MHTLVDTETPLYLHTQTHTHTQRGPHPWIDTIVHINAVMFAVSSSRTNTEAPTLAEDWIRGRGRGQSSDTNNDITEPGTHRGVERERGGSMGR